MLDCTGFNIFPVLKSEVSCHHLTERNAKQKENEHGKRPSKTEH